MELDLLVKNGNVVFPDRGVQQVDIGINGGKVVSLIQRGQGTTAKQTIDAEGLYVFPGAIDPHMHIGIYNDLAQDFAKETKAAAIGGITSIVNYYRGKQSYHETVPGLIEAGEKNSVLDFTFSLGVLTKQHIQELEAYVKKFGITSYKFYRNYQDKIGAIFGVEDPLTLDSADMMYLLHKFAATSEQLVLCVHCEDMDVQRRVEAELKTGKDGENTLAFFSKTSPDYVEAVSVLGALYLNQIAGGNLYIVHMSSGKSVDLLEQFPGLQQQALTVETCPHYLALTEESPCGLLAKVNPPIHTAEDREKLWEGIRKGLITTIGSDNCPNDLDKKYSKGSGVWDVLPGFPGAGIILPLLISEGYHQRGIPLETIARVSSYNVAKAMKLSNKGDIKIGADADLAIVDLGWEREVSSEVFGASDYSVYEGMKLKGWPVFTLSRGEIIAEKGQLVVDKGRGLFLKRTGI